MTRKEKVGLCLREHTLKALENERLDKAGVNADTIARELKLDRANVSKELNKMWQEGAAIKIQGRPVLFLDFKTLSDAYPQSFFPNTISKNMNIAEYIKADGKKRNVDLEANISTGFIGAEGSFLVPLMRAKAAITYPPYGIPVLLVSRSQAAIKNFIEYLFNITRSEGSKPSDSRMITVDCFGCELAPDTFTRKLFGC